MDRSYQKLQIQVILSNIWNVGYYNMPKIHELYKLFIHPKHVYQIICANCWDSTKKHRNKMLTYNHDDFLVSFILF